MSQEHLAAISNSTGDQNQDKTVPVCPSCGSKLTRRSMRRSWQDRVKSLFGQWPYRCQMCNMRFTGPKDPNAIARHNASAEEALRDQEDAQLLEGEERGKHPEDTSHKPDRK